MITTDETNLETYVTRFSHQPRYVKYINQVHILWAHGYTMAGIAHILHIDCACVRYCMHALNLPPNYSKHTTNHILNKLKISYKSTSRIWIHEIFVYCMIMSTNISESIQILN